MSDRLLRREERIGCCDRHMQLPLGYQPRTRFDGLHQFWGSVKRWVSIPEAAYRYIAIDEIHKACQTGLAAHRVIEHQRAPRAQATGQREHRFSPDAVDR